MSSQHGRNPARRIQAFLAIVLVSATLGCSDAAPDRESDADEAFDHPRTVRVASDGRLVVADVGTGENDGRVVAIDTGDRVETLLEDLPSTRDSGQRYADLAGPSGADLAPDGTACAVIGDAREANPGFGTLQCTDGLVVDLEAFERRVNPDGLALESNPYDVVSDGRGGWYVSDAAANAVLHVSEDAGGQPSIQVVSTFGSLPAQEPNRKVQGVPTGLFRQPDGRIQVALHGGAPYGNGDGVVILLDPHAASDAERTRIMARAPFPIAALSTTDGDLAVLSRGKRPSDETGGRILLAPPTGTSGGTPEPVATGLASPTGFALLPDGDFVVAEEAAGRLRRVDS